MRTGRGILTALCVCGLAAERRIARDAGFDAAIGVNANATARADLLISFGIAGGLARDLQPGTVILSGEVVTEEGHYRTAPPLAEAIGGWAARLGAIEGTVYGSRTILTTGPAKAECRAKAGSPLAVDLESGALARVAAQRGIPFVILRAIADPAWRDLPAAALLPLVEGRPDLPRVLASMMRQPGQIPALIGLARETRRALRALVVPARTLRRLIGP